MTLDDFLHSNRISNVAFAAKIAVDQSTIARLRKGGQIPSKEVMAAIFEETNGEVRPDDFYGVAA